MLMASDLGLLDFYLRGNDIICLSETKTDTPNLSNSFLSDYKRISLQKSLNGQKYGGFHGISLLLKKEIFQFAEKIQSTTSQSVLWVKCMNKS